MKQYSQGVFQQCLTFTQLFVKLNMINKATLMTLHCKQHKIILIAAVLILPLEEQCQLKKRLVTMHRAHKVESIPGKDAYGYLLCNAHLLPQSARKKLLDSNLRLKPISILKQEKKMLKVGVILFKEEIGNEIRW